MNFSYIALFFCLFAVVSAGPSARAKDLFERVTRAYLTDPQGTYSGSTTVIGQTITVTITVIDSTTASLTTSGALTVNCPKEEYSYQNGVISLPTAGNAGDCIHDALDNNGASLNSITYDPKSDQVTAKLQYSFLVISIQLKHKSDPISARVNTAVVASVPQIPLREAFLKYFVVYSLQDPSGTYKGSKSILGEDFTGIIVINSDSTFDFSLSGAVSINCNNEPYTYANGVVTVTNLGVAGDCLHDVLSQYGATLKSIDYDTSTDTINVDIKYAFINIDFALQHQG
eukprot:c22043_g5_i1.p1 GENE.c22043_g5_i1~~c22043_g5_i1.p1  ORF type:complete len:286 (-),score=96.10 c22043_g5_i1:86-943(-)